MLYHVAAVVLPRYAMARRNNIVSGDFPSDQVQVGNYVVGYNLGQRIEAAGYNTLGERPRKGIECVAGQFAACVKMSE